MLRLRYNAEKSELGLGTVIRSALPVLTLAKASGRDKRKFALDNYSPSMQRFALKNRRSVPIGDVEIQARNGLNLQPIHDGFSINTVD